MREIKEIKQLFADNIIKIVFLVLVILTTTYVAVFFGFITFEADRRLNKIVDEALSFKGYTKHGNKQSDSDSVTSKTLATQFATQRQLIPQQADSAAKHGGRSRNKSFVIYGGSDTGKTYFIKKLLKCNS